MLEKTIIMTNLTQVNVEFELRTVLQRKIHMYMTMNTSVCEASMFRHFLAVWMQNLDAGAGRFAVFKKKTGSRKGFLSLDFSSSVFFR